MLLCVTIQLLLLYAAGILGESSEEPPPHWATTIMAALNKRDSFLEPVRTIVEDYTIDNIKLALPILKELESGIQNFHEVNFFTTKQHDDPEVLEFFRQIDAKYTKLQVRDLFRSPSHEQDYKQSGLGYMLAAFKNSYDTDCLYQMISPPSVPRDFVMPREKMCAGSAAPNIDYAPISTVCVDYSTCVQSSGDSDNACTEDNKCDVQEAVPRFAALLWYKISDYLAHVICGTLNAENRETAFANLKRDVKHLMAYMSVTDWDNFFKDAVVEGGFADLPTLMDIVDVRREFMRHVAVACVELKSEKMCVVADILKQHTLLGKIKNGSMASGPVRDLRRKGNRNIKELLRLNQEEMRHLRTLAAIRSVDENLESVATGLGEYFKTLAQFDEGIGDADESYIKGKLKDFEEKATDVDKKLNKDVRDLMIIVQTSLTMQLISEVAKLGMIIAENSNPIKVLLTGVDVDAIYEQTIAVADAVGDVATGAALVEAIKDLGKDSLALLQNFEKNREQLDGLEALVDTIQSGQADKVKDHADKFIEEYGAYTPQVSREELELNSASWSAYKSSACDLLNGAEGDIEIPVGQTAAGIMLLCESLEGTLAEFFTLREDIFDFQFDLVDAFTAVVRGNIATKLAESIQTENNKLNVYQLVRGFFMQHYNLQSNAFLYCNIMQYKHHGKRDAVCPDTGFFDYNNLNKLIAIDEPTYYSEERYVFIPTSPEYRGDPGYINLPSLADGNEVEFQLPRNREWLMENKWVTCNEVIAPFVTSVKVYLPLRNYEGVEERHTITTTMIKNHLGSYSHHNKTVRFILPGSAGTYITTYEEGFQQCSPEDVIRDPYSHCEPIPNLCDSTNQNVVMQLRPTILSTWKLSYNIYSGSERLEWIAPKPATKLYLRAKVSLLMLHDPSVQCAATSTSSRKKRSATCCHHGNQYFVRWENRCKNCPENSTSHLGGYYCERDV